MKLEAPGYGVGKKIKAKKRHILVDALGLPQKVVVHSASNQIVMAPYSRFRRLVFPFIERSFAMAAAGEKPPWPLCRRSSRGTSQIIK